MLVHGQKRSVNPAVLEREHHSNLEKEEAAQETKWPNQVVSRVAQRLVHQESALSLLRCEAQLSPESPASCQETELAGAEAAD